MRVRGGELDYEFRGGGVESHGTLLPTELSGARPAPRPPSALVL